MDFGRKNKITNDLDQLFKSENNIEICFMILWSLFPDIINFYFEKKCIKINEKLTQENSNVVIPYEVNAYERIEKNRNPSSLVLIQYPLRITILQ